MLDLKFVIDNMDEVIKRLSTRNGDFSYLKELTTLSDKRRVLIVDGEKIKAQRNEISKNVGIFKRENKDTTSLLENVQTLGDDIKAIDDELKSIEEEIHNMLASTPNLPNKDIPVGKDETSNKELYKVGKPKKFSFKIKDHIELGESLGILDFERAAKITGSRFVMYKGLGARLERALIQFMMDLHSLENGYTEIIPPYIVNGKSMFSTGQFPKFVEDSFKLEKQDWYLNPTAEVPTINMYRDEILIGEDLPLCYCAYTTAFRSEAGSAGRDTRGILRQHQFNKVELIKFSKPEDSYDDLEKLLANSEEVLKRLELPYRVIELCTGDIGFAMAKTFDIEVWIPAQDCYREIGSISNAEDFQARRANIRFKRTKESKTEYIHTLNGSGLAVGRTVIAILENNQNEDGSITIPKVLIPYMHTKIIK